MQAPVDRQHNMGHSVPLLLESFPVPPSTPSGLSFNHANTSEPLNEPSSSTSSTSSISPSSSVLSTSSTSSNPPPSLPPAAPLPPVPGRSKISDHQVAHILQSRRSSKYSINSSHSGNGSYDRPDSVASYASARSNGASYAYGHGYRELEIRETRRTSRGSGRARPPEVQVTTEDTEDNSQAYGGLRIDEEGDGDVQLTSLRLSISPMPPSPTDTDNELEIPSSLSTQFPTPPPLSPFALQQANAMKNRASSAASMPMKWSAPPSPLYQPNTAPPLRPASPDESLAEISMHDLLSGEDDAESEWDVPTTKPPVSKASEKRRVSGGGMPPPTSFTASVPMRSESRSSLRRKARISVENLDNVNRKASIASIPVLPDPSSKPSHTTQNQCVSSSPSLPSPPTSYPTPPATYPTSPSSSAPVSAYDPDAEIDLHRSFHRELRSARSRSRSHRERLNSTSSPQSPPSPPAEVAWPPMPPMPSTAEIYNQKRSQSRRKASQASSTSMASATADSDDGRVSPDVQKLLERTPRPRRSMSMGEGRGSISSRKSGHAGSDGGWDEFGGPNSRRGRTESQRRLGHNEAVEAKLRKLEQELEGVGSGSEGETASRRYSYGDGFGFGASKEGEENDDNALDSDASDSSLDLHTPLPNLMLRHGLLSPNSKLLPASASVDSLASLATDNGVVGGARPGSMMSMLSNASIQTKSGLFKDTRDTSTRRLRHKDGRLLRGGIGLTTGLGWSDSEDDGAPSALTRRLSSLNLSHKSSSSSLVKSRTRSKSYGNLRASASLPSVSRPSTSTRSSTFSYSSRSNYNALSRSYSSRTLDTDLDEVDEINEFGEVNLDHSIGGNGPPMLQSSKRSIVNGQAKSLRSSSSTLSMKTSISHLTAGEKTPKTSGAGNRLARSGSEASNRSSASDLAMSTSRYVTDELAVLTPSSTASSLSILLTPKDDDSLEGTPTTSLAARSQLNVDKMLPSLPNPKTGSIRRPTPSSIKKSSLKKPSEVSTHSTHSFPSIASDTNINSSSSSNSISHAAMTSPRQLKQLQLPRQQSVMNVNGQLPVPVPNSNGGSSRLRMPSTPSLASHSAPVTPTTPSTPTDHAKPKSRVGTGMAYHTSSSRNISRMRPPSGKSPVVAPKF
ncbi:hypothetical protein DFJ43DRAFT_1075407 [Lentinula guzmanii]|uniref:Uncharacterized protein n=1 Tax=Lentinula guzmanii TaxID=2804957 RepID=A0AA38JK34_9AGAR|nr:hypothetical protein DFJ43DRAFT_1075407 [Lentinula guzmanii]